MATSDLNHVEISPPAASLVYRNEEPGLCILRNEGLNRIGIMHNNISGHNPIVYDPRPVFRHPGRFITSTDESCTHDAVQRRGLYYPEQFDGSFLPLSSGGNTIYQSSVHNRGISSSNNRNVYTRGNIPHGSQANVSFSSFGHNMVGGFSSSGQNLVGGFLSPGQDMGGCAMDIDGHGTNPRANSSPCNVFRRPQRCLQHYFPMPNDRIQSLGGNEDARYVNGGPYRCFQGPDAASRPFSSQAGLPHKTHARFSRMGSVNTTFTRIPSERNSSRLQHGHKNTVKTFPIESSKVSPTVRTTGSTNGKNRSGQPGQAQGSQPTQFGKDPAPPVKRTGIHKTSAPRQVWRRKTNTQPSISPAKSKTKNEPSISPSKPSSKRNVPIYHITWNGFDEPCQTVGQICHICKGDLAYAPTNYAFEPSNLLDVAVLPYNLPEIAVLPCGHAFHNGCLQHIMPKEHSRDPPCEICANGKF